MKICFCACLLAAAFFLLGGCRTEDDNFSVHRDPAAADSVPVPGAATPPPNAHSAGWW